MKGVVNFFWPEGGGRGRGYPMHDSQPKIHFEYKPKEVKI